jgi:tetratricopeptide (TPR) repeat protein
MAVAMPNRVAVPDGPLRRLVQAIHELYTAAGRPGVRQISNAIRDREDLRDTVSHETISSMLRGDGRPRWIKLECVVRQLADWSVEHPDPDAEVRRFLQLWLNAENQPISVAATEALPPVRAQVSPVREDGAEYTADHRGGPATISNMPARNSQFIGRRALLELMRNEIRRNTRRLMIVRGIGGVGKTQLAIEYTYRYAAEYDLVWWIPAEEPVQARAALAALAERLDLPRSKDLNQTARAALTALEDSELRWLLVFDNANDSSALRAVLPAGGDVLVTTRTLGWSRLGTVVEADVFDRAESVELLCLRGRGIGPAEADLLAARLGDLPLALEQVAAVQSATGMSVPDYLQLFAEHVGDLLSTQPPQEYPTSVAAFVTLAVDSLRSRAPAAAQLLELFAFLGAEPVPVSLLRTGRAANIEPPLGRALYEFDFIDRVVSHLVRYGVARLEPQGERIQVHRLVRSVLREQLDPEDADRIRETTHRLLGAANPGNADDPRTWTLHAEIGPHLIPSDAVHSRVKAVLHAVVDQVRYLERRGEYEESRRLGLLAVEAWSAPPEAGGLGTEHDLTVRAIRDVANVLRALGSYDEARRITEEALSRLRASPNHGEDHPNTLDLAGAVGIYLRKTGSYREALAMDRDVVERRRRIGGEAHPATLRAMGNLAVSLRMNGMFAEAYSVDLQARAAFAQMLGPDHPTALMPAANLARDLYGLGRYAESLETINEVLAQQIALHGSSHEFVLQSTRLQAITLRRVGRRREAVALTRDNFRASDRTVGPNHENTLLSMMSYANALRSVGDLVGARTIAAEALARCRTAFGPRNPATLAVATNFTIILRALGDRNEAYSIDQLTVPELRQAVEDDHPYTLAATSGLAADLALNHEPASALALSRDLVQRATGLLGPDHPTTLGFTANLGLDLIAAGDVATGQELRARAVAELSATDGDFEEASFATARIECDIEPPES